MTVAVCAACGERKHGAFTPCPACDHTPEPGFDEDVHLRLTDHFHSLAELDVISDAIRKGMKLLDAEPRKRRARPDVQATMRHFMSLHFDAVNEAYERGGLAAARSTLEGLQKKDPALAALEARELRGSFMVVLKAPERGPRR